MAGVLLKGVTKRYGDVIAVDHLDLEVEDREFLVLLGPSGCGKTTTMRMIAGLESITEGEIYIGDRLVNDVLPKHRDVAMVFQSYALYPHMTVYRNIEYPLKIRKIPAGERERAVRAAAKRVELDALLDRRPRELSGGQRQRVALARALVREPTVFLLDEPLSNLDAKLRTQMRAELKHLQRELAVTTVYVTHDQIEAMTLADRIALLRDGVLQQIATPQAIYNDPDNLFVAGFIGSPAMNFLEGRLEGGRFFGPDLEVPVSIGGARPRALLGVRPEDAALVAVADADLVAPIYSIELTGESTFVSVRLGGELFAVRTEKVFRGGIGDEIGIHIDSDRGFLFDAESEGRIRP